MKYISTRGGGEAADFQTAVLTGLARDGGLFLPAAIPDVRADLSAWADLDYGALALEVMRRFADLPADDLRKLIGGSYATFRHPDVTPVVAVNGVHMLELLHGPTLAFKDVALQFLGRVFEYYLAQSGRRLNILAATSGVESTRPLTARTDGRTAPFGERVRERWDSFFTPLAAFVRQPRFVMSFGMIFFSFSLALSTAGVKPADVAKISLRPSVLRHAYNDAQIKVVKYYDNIRFVYEIESKMRELRRTNTPAEPRPAEPKENRKNDTSGEPDQRQDRDYSQEYNQPVLAALDGTPITPLLGDGAGNASPAMTVAFAATTNWRFV